MKQNKVTHSITIAVIATLIGMLFGIHNSWAQAQPAPVDTERAIKKNKINIEAEAIKGMGIEEGSDISPTFLSSRSSLSSNEDKFFNTAPFDKIKPLYLDPNYKNLTSLYWKTGRLDERENNHIDSYLFLLQCTKVKHLYANDLTWNKVRNSTQKYLKENKKHFGRRFSVTQPLEFQKYDFEQGGFTISEAYSYKNSKRLRISNNQFARTDFCFPKLPFINDYIKEAPYNVVLALRSPFNLQYVPMKEELSEHYLNYIQENNKKKQAYLTLYTTLKLYKDTTIHAQVSGSYLSEYAGTIDYIEVHADPEKKLLLYAKDMRK